MTLSFHPEAERELIQAINYYEDKERDLGRDFAIEIYAAIERIISYPVAWPLIEDKIRRALIKRFPYGVIYTQIDAEIVILAIMHLNKEPDYWKGRV